VTNGLSFRIIYSNRKAASTQEIVFPNGLNIIYGESGIGKSELAKLLTSERKNDEFRFKIEDQSITTDIHIAQQNPDQQIIGNSILNELAFNLECKYTNSTEIKNELEVILKDLLFDVDSSRHPTTLSGGEKELLNISTAQSLNPKVLVLDDSLSFLSSRMKNRVVEKLTRDCITILWFTSDYNDLLYSDSNWEMTEDSICQLESFTKSVMNEISLKRGEISLNTNKLHFAYDANSIFTNLNISINNFRCLGIVGENGCGKSTLALLLLNIEKPSSGKINLTYGRDEQINIGFLDQFPERLIGINTIEEFMTKLISNNILEESKILAIIKDLTELKIDWESIRSVSGNHLSWTLLRIVLICILANCNYDILILDEPTFGMGLKQKNKLRSYLIRYLDKKHLILISHDKLFVESICDEIVEL